MIVIAGPYPRVFTMIDQPSIPIVQQGQTLLLDIGLLLTIIHHCRPLSFDDSWQSTIISGILVQGCNHHLPVIDHQEPSHWIIVFKHDWPLLIIHPRIMSHSHSPTPFPNHQFPEIINRHYPSFVIYLTLIHYSWPSSLNIIKRSSPSPTIVDHS